MRICQVGNFEPAHSTENEIRKAWEALGHHVETIQEQHADWATLPERADCDLLMWTRTADLDHEPHDVKVAALERFESAGIPTVAYHLDRWFGLHREASVGREAFFRCGIVVTADGGHQDRFAQLGVNHHWLPPAVSEFECAHGVSSDEYASDVAFVGSWQGYHREWKHRTALVKCLQHTYPDQVRCWPAAGQPAVRGEALRDLYASTKVNVGDSCLSGGATHYWSDRIPETLGRGGFLLHPNVEGLSDWFTPGEHLDTWDVGDWDGLRDLVDYYLEDHEARETIAAAGRAHVLEHHTYTVRMRQLCDLVLAEGYYVAVAA
jgi:hypothetical protein